MTPDQPQDEQSVLERYRRASAADAARPLAATRAAILAEAARVAAAQSQPNTLKPFDTRQRAVNQGRFRLAAYGTLGAGLFAALLMIPLYHPASPPPESVSRVVVPPAPVPATGESGAGAAPAALAAKASGAAPLPAPRRVPVTPQPRASEPSAPEAAARAATPAPAAVAPPVDRARADRHEESEEVVIRQPAPSASASTLSHAMNQTTRALHAAPAPLLRAVSSGDLAQTRQLVEQGASLRAADDAGRNALFLAVIERRADLVTLLLEHGADPLAADRAGQTPLDWARQQHYDEVVTLLSASASAP